MITCDAAVEVLKEMGLKSFTSADTHVIRRIGDRAGLSKIGCISIDKKVVVNLSRKPGSLIKTHTWKGASGSILKFELP